MNGNNNIITKPGTGIRVISFFSGAGGLDLGFEQAGYEIVFATDINGMCCETLKANKGGNISNNTEVLQADIRHLDLSHLPQNVDLIIGGPPCQSFSASGRRAGGAPGRLDDRGTLFEAYCRLVNAIKPCAFLFENVRGILGTNKGEDWRIIVQAFRDIGYKLSYRILDALDYGVPQQRERMFLVGHRLDDEFLFPEPLYGSDSSSGLPYINAQQALVELSDEEDKEQLYLREGKYSHLLPMVPPGENYLYFTAKRGYPEPIFAYRSRFSDFLYKANPNTPIKTLIARPGKYTGPFHWDNRCFTVAEYKRLQGFPDDYIFVGGRDESIKQIGNSVSPKIAYQMALCIAKQIFSRESSVKLMPVGKHLSFDKRKSQKAKRTKEMHEQVAKKAVHEGLSIFRLESYKSNITPNGLTKEKGNCSVVIKGKRAVVSVHADESKTRFAKMIIEIKQSHNQGINTEPEVILEVIAYGEQDYTIQTMWNAVDDWVIRSSNFHSLFELYGHFTEPHPIFEITNFTVYTKHPIAKFAKHCSRFENCSTYFPREHLTSLFGLAFRKTNFVDLVKLLRGYRFDIRCYETNIAIPKDVYMVSYPFALPYNKQMNFSIRPIKTNGTKEKLENSI